MIEREPLLTAEPSVKVGSLEALLGLANAIEVEAVARYDQLAALMEARGEAATAAVFHDMREIEQRHVAWVARLGERLHQKVPPAGHFAWNLSPDIATSWDTIQHSNRLTPYRALAIAVTNEERAFALYSYVAAQTEDPDVAREAEALAREELAHAAELRVKRRLAFHEAQPVGARPERLRVGSLDEFRDLEARQAGETAAALYGVAAALRRRGDAESAGLVGEMAEQEARLAPAAALAPKARQDETGSRDLLQEALRVLEGASEIYEELAAAAEQEALLQAAQASLQRIVEGISRLSARLAKITAQSDEPLQ